MKKAAHALVIALWIGIPVATWGSPPDIIWSIGQVDGSNEDLALFGEFSDYAHRFPDDIHYVVGTSRPESAWPATRTGRRLVWFQASSLRDSVRFTRSSTRFLPGGK